MRFRSGLVLTLAAGLVMGGCAAGAAGGGGPSVSPTGKTYEPGIAPSNSRFTTPVTLYIAQGQFEQALQEAQQAVAADSANPRHYFLLGQAHAGLGNFEEANAAWERAEQIYPAYELEVEPARESAWADAFNEGVEAYNANDLAAAATAWERATVIYQLRPEAYQNLAAIYTQQGDYERAIAAYQGALSSIENVPAARVLEAEEIEEREGTRGVALENLAELLLFTDQYAQAEELFRQQTQANPDDVSLQGKLAAAIAAQPGREGEAQALYNELLGRPDLDAATLMEIGVVLFQQQDFTRAAEAFERVTDARPNSRDAWYNLANSLYAAENWEELIPVGQRLMELDPLNYDGSLMLARAFRDAGQQPNALRELERIEAAQVKLQRLQTRQGSGQTIVAGEVLGGQAAPGTPIRLVFTFFGEGGAQLGSQTLTVNAPATDQTTPFEVVLQTDTPAVGYSYQLAN